MYRFMQFFRKITVFFLYMQKFCKKNLELAQCFFRNKELFYDLPKKSICLIISQNYYLGTNDCHLIFSSRCGVDRL